MMEAGNVRAWQCRDRGGSAAVWPHRVCGRRILNVIEQSSKRNGGNACGGHSAAIGAMWDATSFAARCEAGWAGSSEAAAFQSHIIYLLPSRAPWRHAQAFEN